MSVTPQRGKGTKRAHLLYLLNRINKHVDRASINCVDEAPHWMLGDVCVLKLMLREREEKVLIVWEGEHVDVVEV